MSGFDWRSIAVRVAAADGQYHLLSTGERDALELAVIEYRQDRLRARLSEVVVLHALPPAAADDPGEGVTSRDE